MAFGGFEQRGGQQPMAEINTTPLVDVMLVLLVIFIITAPLITHSIRMDLPDARAKAASEQPDAILLAVDAAVKIYWNNVALSGLSELEEKFRAAAQAKVPPPIQLRADRNTRYQVIADIMAAAQQTGLTRLGFVTAPAVDSPQASPASR